MGGITEAKSEGDFGEIEPALNEQVAGADHPALVIVFIRRAAGLIFK